MGLGSSVFLSDGRPVILRPGDRDDREAFIFWTATEAAQLERILVIRLSPDVMAQILAFLGGCLEDEIMYVDVINEFFVW